MNSTATATADSNSLIIIGACTAAIVLGGLATAIVVIYSVRWPVAIKPVTSTRVSNDDRWPRSPSSKYLEKSPSKSKLKRSPSKSKVAPAKESLSDLRETTTEALVTGHHTTPHKEKQLAAARDAAFQAERERLSEASGGKKPARRCGTPPGKPPSTPPTPAPALSQAGSGRGGRGGRQGSSGRLSGGASGERGSGRLSGAGRGGRARGRG